jgi:ribosomal protein S18 acetylase RimI-like enzyme
MKHVLDNPVWHALISGNTTLARGIDNVKFFPKEVSPIVGLQDFTTASFDALYEMIPFDSPVVIFTVDKLVIPPMWRGMHHLTGLQMVYAGSALPPLPAEEEIVSLTDEHIPHMLALTRLTNPGPFSSRTIDFGHYEGIFKEGVLVAMAGQRLHPYNYAEISAVCTHPNYTGKGYARQLLLRQMHRIAGAGNTPFLHVKHENDRAINVYKNIGFETRSEISFIVLEKEKAANCL